MLKMMKAKEYLTKRKNNMQYTMKTYIRPGNQKVK